MTPYPPGESTTGHVLGEVGVLKYIEGFGVYYNTCQTLPTCIILHAIDYISLFPLAHMPSETLLMYRLGADT